MRAMTVIPSTSGSAAISSFDEPVGTGEVLVAGVAVGICGTDVEIADGLYGTAPEGADRLVAGHEPRGRVLEARAGSGPAPGHRVVGRVWRPERDPRAAGDGMRVMWGKGRWAVLEDE